MRTTISLDEDLLKRARRVALDRGISFNELVVTALRVELSRTTTHPKIFDPPTDPELALQFVQTIRESTEHVLIAPGPRHWSIFTRLVRESGCRGNLIPDAFLAAIAIGSGCTWISTDRDYSKFNGLDWRHPLDS